jgi:hypothetical protein
MSVIFIVIFIILGSLHLFQRRSKTILKIDNTPSVPDGEYRIE